MSKERVLRMSEKIQFGSVCSGIEAASVAWNSLGWTALWFSEIDPFPCEVLRQRFPDVPNLGDMTTIKERILSGEIQAPDVLCGGTPCQSFSVAGRRRSLEDDRGNLALIFTEIADAIDIVRVRSGRQESIIFWENVPGVLRTKDNAFGCFLGQLVGAEFPLSSGTDGNKWPSAGFATGPKRSVAWRTLDAQFFGVPQCRQRVFVVSSARNDINLAETLFEQKIVRRNSIESRKEEQTAAARAENSTAQHDDSKRFLKVYDAPHNFSHISEHDTCPTLIARAGTGGGNVPIVVYENDCDTVEDVIYPPQIKITAPRFLLLKT